MASERGGQGTSESRCDKRHTALAVIRTDDITVQNTKMEGTAFRTRTRRETNCQLECTGDVAASEQWTQMTTHLEGSRGSIQTAWRRSAAGLASRTKLEECRRGERPGEKGPKHAAPD